MRSRAVVLAVGVMVMMLMLTSAALASSGHHGHHDRDRHDHNDRHDRHDRRGHGRGITITGGVGKADRHHRHHPPKTSSDALRYLGERHRKRDRQHAGAGYLRADPFILTMPDRAATMLSGWIRLKRGVAGSVATIGLVDLASLKKGQAGRQEGAFYVYTRSDGRVQVGLTDGNVGGELVQRSQYFEPGHVPDKIWVEFTVERTNDPDELRECANIDADVVTADGCMTLVINDGPSIVDSFGSISADGFDDEFADGAVPGWEAYPGGRTGIEYALRVAPAYAR